MSEQIKWSIDQAHSEIAFKVRHLMISQIRGVFKVFDASIYTTGKDFTNAEIDIWMDTSSVSTGDAGRDEHLKSEDFFNAEIYPQIRFTASTMQKSDAPGPGMYEVWGELTMVGITKRIKLELHFGGLANDPSGKERAGFSVKGTINRKDWGLEWNTVLEAGGLVVSDEVAISCDVELINVGYKHLVMELEGNIPAEIS
ncbi:MAG: YceI family protein [Saprospiraceae bacterium]|nr:YceI family protein [Saprospiraceae bacterium]